MRISKGIIQILVFLCITVTLLFCRPMRALAKEADVSFGSESYSKRNNEEFPVGVYIRGESKIGAYYVEVQYDTDRMEYISGGDSEQDGVVILRGTGLRDRVKYMLNFRSKGGGSAGIRIRYAEVTEAVEAGGEAFTITSLGTAPITIAGTDETGISFFEKMAAEDAANEANEGGSPGNEGEGLDGETGDPGNEGESSNGENENPDNPGSDTGQENEIRDSDLNEANRAANLENWGIDSNLPILAAVDTGDGRLRYIVDHEKYVPDTAAWSYQTMQGTCLGYQITFLTNRTGTVRILYLMDQIIMDGVLIAESFQPFAYSTENGLLYSCQETESNGQVYFYMSAYACSEWPEELTLKAIIEEYVFIVMDMKGETGFYQFDQNNNLVPWNQDASRATTSAQTRNLVYILAAAFIAIGLVCSLTYRAVLIKEKKQRRHLKSGSTQNGKTVKGYQDRKQKSAKGNQSRKQKSANGSQNQKQYSTGGNQNRKQQNAKGNQSRRQPDKIGNQNKKSQDIRGNQNRKSQDTREKQNRNTQNARGKQNRKSQDADYGFYDIKNNKYIDDYDLNVAEDSIIDYDLDAEEFQDNYSQKSVITQCCDGAGAETHDNPASEDDESLQAPVISVQDVTMVFHISTSNASGIKEYLIQWIKQQVTFRELTALDHVSFDVFKGEVVGIIGTNGSGKSTLLRIVSGALKPSGGRVVVDRKKVQLLTLGTGFDMELSAKENVYLNGSIIGYSQEFLDAHYQEIVEFAELQDFMEEKVKNFSSGMVSRLGFAIATAGDAAEILILDEVLSVGDEFFRKKSLKRIKEMIHGGSTVLMVSHGMETILENCTKVVWIEKGKLRMVGAVKEVCRAYQRLNEIL